MSGVKKLSVINDMHDTTYIGVKDTWIVHSGVKGKIIQRVINMKVISSGNTYEIFDDTLRVYEKLPAQNYIVRFSKFKGFYLDK